MNQMTPDVYEQVIQEVADALTGYRIGDASIITEVATVRRRRILPTQEHHNG